VASRNRTAITTATVNQISQLIDPGCSRPL
jgi:hypothetical protein